MDGAAEKKRVALGSVIAAAGLMALKLFVGLATGSLGILAEAANSALDVVAALVLFLAIDMSAKPADRTHLYGHGKIESLSALLQKLLLFATCGWIFYEAVERLLSRDSTIAIPFWSFLVMAISIIVSLWRAHALMRAAKKYNSQALGADALHFSSDVWTALVVILGLICIRFASYFPQYQFLKRADEVAAIIVVLIVFYAGIRLGKRTIDALVDAAPPGMEEKIRKIVEDIPEIFDCHQVRIRYSGAKLFVDLHVLVDGRQTLTEAHALTEVIEQRIEEQIPNTDVTVHPEPK